AAVVDPQIQGQQNLLFRQMLQDFDPPAWVKEVIVEADAAFVAKAPSSSSPSKAGAMSLAWRAPGSWPTARTCAIWRVTLPAPALSALGLTNPTAAGEATGSLGARPACAIWGMSRFSCPNGGATTGRSGSTSS